MQGRRALDVLLDEMLVVLRGDDVEPAVGDDAAALDRVLAGLRERDELAFDRAFRELESRDPANRLERRLARTLERVDERPQLTRGGRAVEAADAHVDRVDLPSAHERHHLVAGLLQGEPTLDGSGRVARELDGARIAEEVGRVEHVDVQGMALDPLAAIEKATQHSDRLGDLDAAEALERVEGARLVGDRADAADAGGDVRRLAKRPPAQQRLEEARRLEDLELDVLDAAVPEPDGHRALALDAGEVVGADRAALTHGQQPPGTARRSR